MLISVIIPTYNCESSIKNTIESLRMSGLTDYEILIVDDGSADATASVCDEICSEFDNVRCIHQNNAGVSAARNTGLENAKGEYVLFFDADDSVEPNSLVNAEEIVKSQAPDMLVFGMRFDYYYKGRCYRRESLVYPEEGMFSLDEIKKYFNAFYDCNALTSACNKIIKRNILIQNSLKFDTSLIIMEDFLFVLNILPFCKKIFCLPEVIYCYKLNEEEDKAHTRLKKVNNLSDFVDNFKAAVEKLEIRNSFDFISAFYGMLLQQKLFNATYSEICKYMNVHLSSEYNNLNIEKAPRKIYLKNIIIKFRHRIAVAFKCIAARIKEIQ